MGKQGIKSKDAAPIRGGFSMGKNQVFCSCLYFCMYFMKNSKKLEFAITLNK